MKYLFAFLLLATAALGQNQTIKPGSAIRFQDTDKSHTVGIKGPGVATANVDYVLPATDGSAGQVLVTDGAGQWYWANDAGAGSSASLTASYVGYGDGTNLLTGESGFQYDAASNTLIAPSFAGTNVTSTNGTFLNLRTTDSGSDDYLTIDVLSNFAADRVLSLSPPDADTIVTIPASITIAGADFENAWADGVKQTFNPGATTAGLNAGSIAGDPSAPANGDLWYDSTANEMTARINGANVALGAGGGGGLVAADIDTSVELVTILTDETGSAGGIVRATGPTLSLPIVDGVKFIDAEGTGGQKVTINVQSDVTADRLVNFAFPDNDALYTFPPSAGASLAAINTTNSWADGIRQTFNPGAVTPGFNVGSIAGDPSTPSNGDVWYDSTDNELTAYINGVATPLGGEVSTTRSGTHASPTVTNPFAVTWPDHEQMVVIYGITGEFDLPAVATYANKSLVIWSAGTYTITVDPNGSEIIVEDGASIGAGTADVIAGTAGLSVCYFCDGARWIKFEGGGGGVASLTPWTENVLGGGFTLSNVNSVTATEFIGGGSGLTDLPGSEINGPLPDLTFGQITTSEAQVFTPVAGASNVVVTTDALTTITLDATTETLTYSGTPTTGTVFHYLLAAHTSDCTVTIPSTYSIATGGNRTTYVVRANKNAYLSVFRSASAYYMWGDPVEIGTLPADSTPAMTAKVEIDQDLGGEHATLANIRDALGTTFNGTAASPNTDNPETVAFDAMTFYHFSGATQELDLPAAAGYVGRGIVIRFDGSYVVTCDPNGGAEVIDLDGTAMSAGEALIITGTAGQVGIIVSDGTSWATSGGSAAYTQETP